MRKLSITVVAAAAILLLNSMGCIANAVTASGSTLPNAAKNFSPNSRNGLPRLGPLVWTRLCQGLWSVQMLVPSLLVKSRESGGRQRQAASVAKINR